MSLAWIREIKQPMARILLTEPDRAIREFIAGILSEFGHDVVASENIVEAEVWLATSPIDVLVTDLVLRSEQGVMLSRSCSALGIPTVTAVARKAVPVFRFATCPARRRDGTIGSGRSSTDEQRRLIKWERSGQLGICRALHDMEPAVTLLDKDGAPPAVCRPAAKPRATRTPRAAGLQATGRVEAEPRIAVEQVARGIVYMANLPLEANVQFMTVMATKMPYIGRG